MPPPPKTENPADLLTRDITASHLLDNIWWNDPRLTIQENTDFDHGLAYHSIQPFHSGWASTSCIFASRCVPAIANLLETLLSLHNSSSLFHVLLITTRTVRFVYKTSCHCETVTRPLKSTKVCARVRFSIGHAEKECFCTEMAVLEGSEALRKT